MDKENLKKYGMVTHSFSVFPAVMKVTIKAWKHNIRLESELTSFQVAPKFSSYSASGNLLGSLWISIFFLIYKITPTLHDYKESSKELNKCQLLFSF